MNSRLKADLQEITKGLLTAGAKNSLSARTLSAVGIDLELPEFTPAEIVHIRSLLGTSQDVFARAIGVTKMTVSKWERGAATPGGSAAVLLAVVRNDPQAIRFRFGITTDDATPRKTRAKTTKVVDINQAAFRKSTSAKPKPKPSAPIPKLSIAAKGTTAKTTGTKQAATPKRKSIA